jgi:hypothetical protein
MPGPTGRGSTTLNLEGDPMGEFLVPVAQRFVAGSDAAFKQEFLHSSKAELEAVQEPEGMVDDLDGEAIPRVTSGVGQIGGHPRERTHSTPT